MAGQPFTFHVTINATPEQVWPLVGDLGRMGEWSPKPYKVEWLSGEPNAVGSTFRSTGWLPQDKEHSMEGTVKVNEPMKTFEVTTPRRQRGVDQPLRSLALWVTDDRDEDGHRAAA